jgi:predicted phosphodiesterase
MTKLICGDIHYPFDDSRAVNIMLKIQQHCRPETVILNGDILDFAELSHFTRDKLEDKPIRESITDACELIEKLQRYSDVVYHMGNHEARLQKYLLSNAPEVEHLIKFNKLINTELNIPIKIVESIGRDTMEKYFDDQLLVGHFNRVSRYSAYTAKMLVEDYKVNIVQSHTHRLGNFFTTGVDRIYQGHEAGCLCDVHPVYTHSPNWQQGFLMCYDAFNIETVRIRDGECLYRGRMYKG